MTEPAGPPPRGDRGAGPRRRAEPARAWAVVAGAAGVLLAAYFLLPLGVFGPHRPVLSWTVFVTALAVIAVLILKHIRDVLLDRPGTHSGIALGVLMCLTLLVFATACRALARHPGQFEGLETRLDALYFTVVTLATVGYGDVTARGQAARLVVLLQIVYDLVLLTGAATALSRHVKTRIGRRDAPARHR
ncbi:potassium channel family protein [Streptomyces sp. NPDC047928]|uniref:potassium channel family protein n=1 Tax=unclassified Streptomyces TaxID=2593676 RepID=UPI00371987ED